MSQNDQKYNLFRGETDLSPEKNKVIPAAQHECFLYSFGSKDDILLKGTKIIKTSWESEDVTGGSGQDSVT
jgi:hypothetical protein